MALEGNRIAVIGAGIGGLAAATALAERRAEVTVFERAPALREVGAGLQIAPNGVSVLEALGLRDAAEVVANVPGAVTLCDGMTGARVARLPLGQYCVGRYGRPYWQFHRADLLDVLAGGARREGAQIVLGAEIGGIDVSGGTVRLAGADGEFDAVIAADGLRSAVRAARFAGEPPRFTGQVAWRAMVKGANLPDLFRDDATRVFMGPGRHVVTYSLREGAALNVVAVEERTTWAEEGWSHPDNPANLARAFAGFAPVVRMLLAQVESVFLWGLFAHPPLPRWSDGRVALLGDAAHPMLPFLAHGATSALEDAWVLAAELDVAASLPDGLAAYEARRAPRTARVQAASVRNGRVYHLPLGARRNAAHLALRLAGQMAPGTLLGRFDWLYGADVVSAEATV